MLILQLMVETGATVEPYGSFVSNLFTRWGDLDISIELANGSYIPSAGKKHKQTLLKDLLKALRKRGICSITLVYYSFVHYKVFVCIQSFCAFYFTIAW